MGALEICEVLTDKCFDFVVMPTAIPGIAMEAKEDLAIFCNTSVKNRLIKIFDIIVEGAADLFLIVGTIVKNILSSGFVQFTLGIALGFVGLAMDIISLAKNSYNTYTAHRNERVTKEILKSFKENILSDEGLFDDININNKLQELEDQLKKLHEKSFKSEVQVAYRTIYVISSLLTALSFICPPLILAGGGLFLVALIAQCIDRKTDLKLSKFVAKKWNKFFGKNKDLIGDINKDIVLNQLSILEDKAEILEPAKAAKNRSGFFASRKKDKSASKNVDKKASVLAFR